MRSDRSPQAFVLSAASAAALRDLSGRLATHLREHPHVHAEDVAHTLASAQDDAAHRAVLLAGDAGGLLGGLDGLAAGTPDPGVISGVADVRPGPGPVLVFSGHGCQWPGMGAELL